ncbi:MAG: ester cyclase [Bacteroidota bacterium]|nr:ester cyclase [Bacteroidota bacterium]
MNKNEVLKFNDQVIEAWNKHDAETFINLCDENAVWKINGGIETYRGKKEIKEYFNRWKSAFPDLHLTIRTSMPADDAVSVEFQFSGTQNGRLKLQNDMPEIPPTHKKVNTYGSYVSRVKNGKVLETNLYTDRLALVEQLGIESELMHHA